MNDKSWSRAYWTVFILAVVLLPISGLLAWFANAMTAGIIEHAFGVDRSGLPNDIAVYVRLGWQGISLITGAILLAISGLCVVRHRAWGTVVAATILIAVQLVFVHGAFISGTPYWRVMWRLSP